MNTNKRNQQVKAERKYFKFSNVLKRHFQSQFVQKLACPDGINRAKWW